MINKTLAFFLFLHRADKLYRASIIVDTKKIIPRPINKAAANKVFLSVGFSFDCPLNLAIKAALTELDTASSADMPEPIKMYTEIFLVCFCCPVPTAYQNRKVSPF